jgi:hypothetical protein
MIANCANKGNGMQMINREIGSIQENYLKPILVCWRSRFSDREDWLGFSDTEEKEFKLFLDNLRLLRAVVEKIVFLTNKEVENIKRGIICVPILSTVFNNDVCEEIAARLATVKIKLKSKDTKKAGEEALVQVGEDTTPSLFRRVLLWLGIGTCVGIYCYYKPESAKNFVQRASDFVKNLLGRGKTILDKSAIFSK